MGVVVITMAVSVPCGSRPEQLSFRLAIPPPPHTHTTNDCHGPTIMSVIMLHTVHTMSIIMHMALCSAWPWSATE